MDGGGDPAQVDEREEAKQATHTRGPLARGGAGLANARRDEGGGGFGGEGRELGVGNDEIRASGAVRARCVHWPARAWPPGLLLQQPPGAAGGEMLLARCRSNRTVARRCCESSHSPHNTTDATVRKLARYGDGACPKALSNTLHASKVGRAAAPRGVSIAEITPS